MLGLIHICALLKCGEVQMKKSSFTKEEDKNNETTKPFFHFLFDCIIFEWKLVSASSKPHTRLIRSHLLLLSQ